MKKVIFLLVMIGGMGVNAYGQNLNHIDNPKQVYPNNPDFHLGVNHEKNVAGPFWIQYDTSDFINQNNLGNFNHGYFAQRLNSAYTINDTGAAFKSDYYTYVMVSYDSITDHTGGINTTYHVNYNTCVGADSFGFFGAQVNYSGTDDTLLFIFLQNVNGVPSSIALQNDTIIIPFNTPLNTHSNFDSGYFNSYVMPLTTPIMLAPYTTFSIKEEYHGSKQDTFEFICGDTYFSGTGGGCPPGQYALQSTFFVNTYYDYGDIFSPWENGRWPDTAKQMGHGNFINQYGEYYWDCNGNGVYDAGEGVSYMQNAEIFFHFNTFEGCDGGIPSSSNPTQSITLYPNPTSGTFTLSIRNYELGIRNCEIRIYDVLGQEVYHQLITLPNSSESSLITLPQLSNGVYFYQLSNSTEIYRGKFVKQ